MDKETSNATIMANYPLLRCVVNNISRGNRIQKEELLSEAFVEAHKALLNFDPEKGSIADRISICVQHKLWYYVKKQNRPQRHFQQISKTGEIELSDIKDLIGSHINKLSDKEKDILQKHYWEGYSFKEIGQMLDEKLHNVYITHRRALTKMKAWITGV